jgi:predicted ATP-dependent serine protease
MSDECPDCGGKMEWMYDVGECYQCGHLESIKNSIWDDPAPSEWKRHMSQRYQEQADQRRKEKS